MAFSHTVLFVALCALIQTPMTIVVGLQRLRTDIHFLDGGDEALLRRMRAHGNYTETVPIALLAMAAAEYSGAPSMLLWTGGALLLTGRLVHYATVMLVGWGNGRAVGMACTFATLVGFALYSLLAQSGAL